MKKIIKCHYGSELSKLAKNTLILCKTKPTQPFLARINMVFQFEGESVHEALTRAARSHMNDESASIFQSKTAITYLSPKSLVKTNNLKTFIDDMVSWREQVKEDASPKDPVPTPQDAPTADKAHQLAKELRETVAYLNEMMDAALKDHGMLIDIDVAVPFVDRGDAPKITVSRIIQEIQL